MKQIFMLLMLGLMTISAKSANSDGLVFLESHKDAIELEDEAVLIVFGTEWCKYCHILKRDMPSLSLDDYKIVILDAEKNKEISREYGIKSYPTSVIMLNKKEVSRKSGYDKEEYQKWLESNRKKQAQKRQAKLRNVFGN